MHHFVKASTQLVSDFFLNIFFLKCTLTKEIFKRNCCTIAFYSVKLGKCFTLGSISLKNVIVKTFNLISV